MNAPEFIPLPLALRVRALNWAGFQLAAHNRRPAPLPSIPAPAPKAIAQAAPRAASGRRWEMTVIFTPNPNAPDQP